MLRRSADDPVRAVLEHLSPEGQEQDETYFGKGTSTGQSLVSSCMEFIERWCARVRPGDVLFEGVYDAAASGARDPREFCLAPVGGYHPSRPIDWAWGYSLSRSETVRVPANLVFFPYESDKKEKYIAWTDSNGLAAGNTLEEAVLHGLLEVIERDAVMITEYNRLPMPDLVAESPTPSVRRLIDSLEARDIRCSFKAAMTDLPFPVIAAFLRHARDPANCSLAFGCHLDPRIALARALTEAVQLLPPSINQEEWFRSGSAERYETPGTHALLLRELPDLSSADLKENIGTCLDILAKAGSEVIAVDLSLTDVPFPVVRIVATQLQPLIHPGDLRLSPRFLEVPVRLGYRDRPLDPGSVRIWPLVGYR